jgi:hypothetical protein
MRIAPMLATLAALALPAPLLAQQLTGQVLTQAGAPVMGYPVIIEGGAGALVAVTGDDGRFTLNAPPGDYRAYPSTEPGSARSLTAQGGRQDIGTWRIQTFDQ